MRIPCEGVLALLPQGCPLLAVTQGIPTQHYFCMNHHIPSVTSRILYLREWESGEVLAHACVRAESLQSCLTLCDLMDCSPPGSSVHRILQARILEWVVMPSCRGSSLSRGWTHVSCISCIAGGFFTHRATREAPAVTVHSDYYVTPAVNHSSDWFPF